MILSPIDNGIVLDHISACAGEVQVAAGAGFTFFDIEGRENSFLVASVTAFFVGVMEGLGIIVGNDGQFAALDGHIATTGVDAVGLALGFRHGNEDLHIVQNQVAVSGQKHRT